MNVRFSALLMFVGCIGTCPASTPKAPMEIVRAQRAEYNAAIAAKNAVRLRTFLVDDYHLISGSSGNLESGADAATRDYADDEFKDPTFATYLRLDAC